jgi:hypothetical protein
MDGQPFTDQQRWQTGETRRPSQLMSAPRHSSRHVAPAPVCAPSPALSLPPDAAPFGPVSIQAAWASPQRTSTCWKAWAARRAAAAALARLWPTAIPTTTPPPTALRAQVRTAREDALSHVLWPRSASSAVVLGGTGPQGGGLRCEGECLAPRLPTAQGPMTLLRRRGTWLGSSWCSTCPTAPQRAPPPATPSARCSRAPSR